jgi:hypothetical protein
VGKDIAHARKNASIALATLSNLPAAAVTGNAAPVIVRMPNAAGTADRQALLRLEHGAAQ